MMTQTHEHKGVLTREGKLRCLLGPVRINDIVAGQNLQKIVDQLPSG